MGNPTGALADTCGEAIGQAASTPSGEIGEPRAEVLTWLGKQLCETLDDSAAEALTICVEVILLDEETPIQEALAQAIGILADEGAPCELSESLRSRWQAACEATDQGSSMLAE